MYSIRLEIKHLVFLTINLLLKPLHHMFNKEIIHVIQTKGYCRLLRETCSSGGFISPVKSCNMVSVQIRKGCNMLLMTPLGIFFEPVFTVMISSLI